MTTPPSDPPAGQHMSQHALQRALWTNFFKKSIPETLMSLVVNVAGGDHRSVVFFFFFEKTE